MLRRRVSQDAVIHEKAAGLVATSWRHTTARAVDQKLPDPQLHSHVLLHAAVRRDRRLVAIDSRSWLVHQRELGAAYRTELARELQQLGFSVRRATGRGGRYFELDATPQPLIDRWSSRHHQVQAAIGQRLLDQRHDLELIIAEGGTNAVDAQDRLKLLDKTGQLSPRQERMAAIQTRSAKAPVTVADLDQAWRHTGISLGASRERIEVLRRQPLDLLVPVDAEKVLVGLTEFDATFPARDARAVALERSAGAPITAALEQLRELRASDDILVLADGTGTTRAHRGYERTVVAITQRLAREHTDPLPAVVTARESDRLDQHLAKVSGRLSDEQRRAIELACGSRRLVVIEGHAGTGKSTTLTGIARAHQATGRKIIVTSTAGLAAERLAGELNRAGVDCDAYSTAALHAAITTGRIKLGPDRTIIHDEAALASTREQLRLLDAVETTGARLIEIGDPRQNQPVGAGGLWYQLHHATDQTGAHVQLTQNQRAHDPADQRDQALFRQGEIHQAIRGYDSRDHVHLHPDQQRAEDQALDAAHVDRAAGKTTIVIAQTSNERLDELNARAQAIRRQHRELGDASVPVPGRPYRLHAGDQIQIRHTIPHPDHGPIRNGTTAQITSIDPRTGEIVLQVADQTELRLDQQQAAAAELRLAYVQHPFPAQGQTTDTTHLIIAEHTTREGSYVALTRARDHTHLYTANTNDETPDLDPIQQLAEQMSHTETDLPSIRTPLAHETTITANVEGTGIDAGRTRLEPELGTNRAAHSASESREPRTTASNGDGDGAEESPAAAKSPARDATGTHPGQARDLDAELESTASRDDTRLADTQVNSNLRDRTPGREHQPSHERAGRTWPTMPHHEPLTWAAAEDRQQRDDAVGWEP